jgi:phosphopantothenoylcysteine decarboxylase/phosphopantothenate--cysteine ligase
MVGKIDADIVLVPAAISDYSPEKQEGKIPSGKKDLTLNLTPNPKVIAKIRDEATCVLVGFKAEFNLSSDELLNRARFRMEDSHLDMIVANDITNTTLYENRVFIIGKDGKITEIAGRKEDIASKILDRVVSMC